MFAMGPAFFKAAGAGYAMLTLSGAFAAATVGVAYSSDLTIAGGDGTYSNPRATVGSVPAGLSLSIVANKLRLSGTPTTSGTVSFTAAVDSGDGQMATSAQSVDVASSSADPYFSYVTALMHCEGANGAQSYTDVTGRVWAASATSAVLSTTSPIHGTSSLRLPSDYLTSTSTAGFAFGLNDFCVELSFRATTIASVDTLIGNYTGDSTTGWSLQYRTDGTVPGFRFGFTGDTHAYDFPFTIAAGVNYDIAAFRVGDNFYFCVDGSQIGSTVTGVSSFSVAGTKPTINGLYYGGYIQSGDITVDEIRVTNGAGRYSGSYTRSFPFRDHA